MQGETVVGPLTPDTEKPTPLPLRRNSLFKVLWIGSAFSVLGLEVADIGYPLVILALTGSPGRAGLFAVVQTLAMLVFGMPAGELVDRFERRRVLLVGEGIRALVMAVVSFALIVHHLTFAPLVAVAAVLGAVQPLSGAARMVLLRAVVPPEQLTAALTRDEIRLSAGQLAGPPLGGALYGLARFAPFVFTASSFALSWCCALLLRLSAKEPEKAAAAEAGRSGADNAPGADGAQESPLVRMFAGIRVLWCDPALRVATLLVATLNFIGAPLALIVVVLLRQQGTPSWEIGVTMSGLAAGGLLGAPLIGPLHKTFRPGVLLLGVGCTTVLMLLALSRPWGPWWVMGVTLAGMLGIPALRVLVDVLIFRQVPDEQRGRVIASVMTLFGAGTPLGIGLAGALLQWYSAAAAMLALAVLLALVIGYSLTQRRLRQAAWPANKSS